MLLNLQALLAASLPIAVCAGPVLQLIRINGAVVLDMGPSHADSQQLQRGATAAGRLQMPFSERAMLGASAASMRLGVVGPITVEWALAQQLGSEGVPECAHSVMITVTDITSSTLLSVETVPEHRRSWSGSNLPALTPHHAFNLTVALVDADSEKQSAQTVSFRAGPTGVASEGNALGGWPATWMGGARTVRGTANFSVALVPGETLLSATLYASTPGTMAWTLENGTRLHDSVLDPGYSNQPDLRSIYVAYDLTPFVNDNTVAVIGSLGFGKYGYLGQWCKGGAFDSKSSTAYLGSSAECKPVTAQIVGVTSSGRVLIGGTGTTELLELDASDSHTIVARWSAPEALPNANEWTGSASGGPLIFSHLYHGEIYDATAELVSPSASGAFVALTPWNLSAHPLGPLSPHAFPTMRPSEAPVPAVDAWAPAASTCCCSGQPCPGCTSCITSPNISTSPSIIFDFGLNYAGSCELRISGRTAALKGLSLRLRYGEALLDGPPSHRELFHPWMPCTAPYSQGAHNCANQTDEYVLRGKPGKVGPTTALGRVPMRTNTGLMISTADGTSEDTAAEVWMASHAIKGGRWVSLSGTALEALLKSTSGSVRFGQDHGAHMCFPPSGVGKLVACAEKPKASDVIISLHMWPLHSDVGVRGSVKLFNRPATSGDSDVDFAWSVDNVNSLQNAIVRTHLNNLHSIPQDCPHREQRGWGGDAQLTAGSAALNFDMKAFYHNWVTSMHDIQLEGDGDLPSYVPRDPARGDKAPAWAAIGVNVPWELWKRTGDASIVALGLNTSKMLINFWQKNLDKSGLLSLGVYGDWSESPKAGPNNAWDTGDECPRGLVEHATYIQCLDHGADLASAAGDATQAMAWRKTASAARAAAEGRWWNSTIGCYGHSCNSQSAQALMFGLNVTSTAHRTQAIDALVASITHWNTSYIAGIVGMRFIHEALSDARRGDLALQLIGRDSSACSGTVSCTFSQWLERGPGSLWEAWDWTEMWSGASANHIMFAGGPGVFIHKAAGSTEEFVTMGLNDPEHAGPLAEATFQVDASIAKHLGGANLWREDERGEVMLQWRRNESSCLDVQIVGPMPRCGRSSWQLFLPVELLGAADDGAALIVESVVGGSLQHTRVSTDRWSVAPTSGTRHEFTVCGTFE